MFYTVAASVGCYVVTLLGTANGTYDVDLTGGANYSLYTKYQNADARASTNRIEGTIHFQQTKQQRFILPREGPWLT